MKNTDKIVRRPKLVKNRINTVPPRIRLKRFLIASVILHIVVQTWTLIYLYLNQPSLEVEDKLRLIVAFDPAEDAPEPEVVEHLDPPTPEDVKTVPESQVIDEPIEPAPWLKPEKVEDSFVPPVLDRHRPRRVGGLSARYRPATSATKAPKAPKAQSPPQVTTTPKSPKKSVSKPQAVIIARKLKGSCPRPHYPRRALRRRLSGRVTFLVDIGINGEVLSLQLEKSSGHDILDRAAEAAIKKWKFIPASRGGKAVRDRVRVPMSFLLPQ